MKPPCTKEARSFLLQLTQFGHFLVCLKRDRIHDNLERIRSPRSLCEREIRVTNPNFTNKPCNLVVFPSFRMSLKKNLITELYLQPKSPIKGFCSKLGPLHTMWATQRSFLPDRMLSPSTVVPLPV
ncbi:hypothetical protein Peur_067409 [Populus x canadensis]